MSAASRQFPPRPPRGGGQTFLIDGYNLLLRAFRFVETQRGLEGARAMLEVRLREFVRNSGPEVKVVLVYDGARGAGVGPAQQDPGAAGGASAGGLQVEFSHPPWTADDQILDFMKSWQGPGTLTVVTSDLKDIAARIRGSGLRHLTSEEFGEAMDEAWKRPRSGAFPPRGALPLGPQGAVSGGDAESPPPEKPARSEKPSPEEITSQEAEDWLRIFSQPKPPRGRRPEEGGSGKRPPGGGRT